MGTLRPRWAANFRNLPKNYHPTKLGDDHTKIIVRVHILFKKCVRSILAMFGDFCKGGSQVGYIWSIWRLAKVPVFLAPDHFSHARSLRRDHPRPFCFSRWTSLTWKYVPKWFIPPEHHCSSFENGSEFFFAILRMRFFHFFLTKKIEKSIFRTESGYYALWPLAHLKGPSKGPLLHLQLLERPPEKKVTIDFLDFFSIFGPKSQNPL